MCVVQIFCLSPYRAYGWKFLESLGLNTSFGVKIGISYICPLESLVSRLLLNTSHPVEHILHYLYYYFISRHNLV